MNAIATYLRTNQISQTEFARTVGVPQSLVYQYINGIRPISEKVSVRIERVTNGALTRKVLRPDDWQDIWPELIQEASHA